MMRRWQDKINEQVAAGKRPNLWTWLFPRRKKYREDLERMTTLLGYASQPKKIPPQIKERLLARLDNQEMTAGSYVVAATDRHWTRLLPGVKQCELAGGPGRRSRLLQIKKGYILPPHKHHETEQAFILDGSCYSGKTLLQQGDFFFAQAGTKHATVRAVEDCVILLVAHQ